MALCEDAVRRNRPASRAETRAASAVLFLWDRHARWLVRHYEHRDRVILRPSFRSCRLPMLLAVRKLRRLAGLQRGRPRAVYGLSRELRKSDRGRQAEN